LLGELVANSKMTSLDVAGEFLHERSDRFIASLAQNHSLAHLDLRRCSVGDLEALQKLCELLASDKLPGLRELVLPSLGRHANLVDMWDHDPIISTHFLASNRALRKVDFSAVGYYGAEIWVDEVPSNRTLEYLCLPDYVSCSRDFAQILAKLSKNLSLIEIDFKAHHGALPADCRPLSKDEQSQMKGVAQRNRMLRQLTLFQLDAAGPALMFSASKARLGPNSAFPCEDVGPIVLGKLVAASGWRSAMSLLLLNRTAQTVKGRAYALLLDRAKDLTHVITLFGEHCARGLTLSSTEAAGIAKHPRLPDMLTQALQSKCLDELLASLSAIGIALPLMRAALSGMSCEYEAVLGALQRSRLGAPRSYRTNFSALTLPAELPPAMSLLVEHGVVLRSGAQFREIEQWCNTNNQIDVLLAAITLGQPKRLEINCSMPGVAQLLKDFTKFPCVTELALSGSLAGDVRVEACVRLAELLRTSKLSGLEMNVECGRVTFRQLMDAFAASARPSSLSVSPFKSPIAIEDWCYDIGQALRRNAQLSVVLELPEKLQAADPVRALVEHSRGRVTFGPSVAS
jgi:hypothetical protein